MQESLYPRKRKITEKQHLKELMKKKKQRTLLF